MKPNDEERTNMKDQNYAAMSEHAHVDGVYPFPAVMQTRTIETNGTSIHVRVGGHGPAVVMLHGFGTTGDMWGHLAGALMPMLSHPKEVADLIEQAAAKVGSH